MDTPITDSWIPLCHIRFNGAAFIFKGVHPTVPTEWHPLKRRNNTVMRQHLLMLKGKNKVPIQAPFTPLSLTPLCPPLLSPYMTLCTIYGLQWKQSTKEQLRRKKLKYFSFLTLTFIFNFILIYIEKKENLASKHVNIFNSMHPCCLLWLFINNRINPKLPTWCDTNSRYSGPFKYNGSPKRINFELLWSICHT